MTASPESSPVPPVDESSLPEGQCRYILLVPGIKGQRCSCTHFSLNHSTPGANCDCGHLACYHVQEPGSFQDKREIEVLKQRLRILEDQVDRGRQGGLGSIIARMGDLEEQLDKSREETSQEIKGTYRNIARVWQSVEQLEQRSVRWHDALQSQAEHLFRIDTEIANIGNRQMELLDADLSLEERIDRMEAVSEESPTPGRGPLPPTLDETPDMPLEPTVLASRLRHGPCETTLEYCGHEGNQLSAGGEAAQHHLASVSACHSLPSTQSTSGSWTVHISLLPTYSQPFPFERNTNAYKRCLSRGLQRTVVIADSTGEAFEMAVSSAFDTVLKGRAWMPLKAKLCDANQLRGLPMLRPLDSRLAGGPFDIDFLRKHCAVCDASGNVESLYISMRHETLSWSFLRNSPIVVDGLEKCWAHDYYLDPSDPFEEDQADDASRRSAGDLMPSLPSLKRNASEVSRSSSFGSSVTTANGGDGEASRNKIQRACLPGVLDSNRRVDAV